MKRRIMVFGRSRTLSHRLIHGLIYRFKPIHLLLTVGYLCTPQLLLAEPSNIPYYDYSNPYGSSLGTPNDSPANPPPSEPSPESPFTRLEIDLSSRQLTLYEGDRQVKTYPVAVGREGWRTPLGNFQVMQMIPDPAWTNPFTGRVIDGGDPANPLGRYWIGFWTDGHNWVGMHGTPNPESVGNAASHGCIRLYNSDIQELFTLVSVGTPVDVVP